MGVGVGELGAAKHELLQVMVEVMMDMMVMMLMTMGDWNGIGKKLPTYRQLCIHS